MKKKNFKVKKFGEPKVTHEAKRVDLIAQYNRMRSIANDIYNSDFFAMASKKEQKEIEASVACISKTLISMIGLDAIDRAGYLPDDSGDADRSWSDNLPDDSGNGIDTNKERHDAIKKIMNIAYDEAKTNGVIKAAAKRVLNSVYGATGSHDAVFDEVEFTHTPYKSRHIDDRATSIMAMNRKILSELGNKHDEVTDDDSDGDEAIDYFEVNLGNFIDGPSYGQQYLDICKQYGFDVADTLKQFEKAASQYYIQMISLVDIVDSQDEITADKYTLESGSVFFVTNKNDDSKSPVFILISAQPYTELRSSDISKISFEIAPVKEESTKTNYVEFVNSDAYFNIGKVHLNPNTVVDLDATLEEIKDKARMHGIDTITFVDTIGNSLDIYNKGKYTLEPGSLFCYRGNGWLNFILIVKDEDTPDMVRIIEPVEKPEENTSLDDIELIGIVEYYSIDNTNPNYTIDLDATLIKIKEMAKEKGIKTITFVDSIGKSPEIFNRSRYSLEVGSLFFVKKCINLANFVLVTESGGTLGDTRIQVIRSVTKSKDDSEEDSSDSKEDDIEVVKDADDETKVVSSDEASPDYVMNQYADVDTSELDPDVYAEVAFPIFMKPTDIGADNSFADICDIYDFDISETVKRIKNAAYLEEIEEVNYIGSFQSFDDIFKTEMATRYGYRDGSLFLVRESTKNKLDPCFVILRKPWDDESQFDAILYRINPVMKTAKIHSIKKIDIIDTYADGDVRIANEIKDLIGIDHTYKIREICDKRNYNYDSITSCLKAVTAIIGGGIRLTFEGTVNSLNSIVLVDPVVAYNTCSVFFVSDFVDGEEGPYFAIRVPITGKTKNGYSFHLYRIYPIPNLNQDPNTDSQDDSNVREIDQFTVIYCANWEVIEADKDAYMTVEFSRINHNDDGEIHSFMHICNDWKFKFHDTIKRIRLVAYMNNFKEIKFAGTACSHEEILEKEVLYSNGSVVFVSDAEDPHFVIVEFIDGYSCLNRINPVKE